MQENEYEHLIRIRRKWYKSIGKVYCRALDVHVVFNSKGFEHLIHDGSREKRNIKESAFRLQILPMSINIIQSTKNISEYRSSTSSKNSVEYWALGNNFRVILRRIGKGQIIFYSIWKRNR